MLPFPRLDTQMLRIQQTIQPSQLAENAEVEPASRRRHAGRRNLAYVSIPLRPRAPRRSLSNSSSPECLEDELRDDYLPNFDSGDETVESNDMDADTDSEISCLAAKRRRTGRNGKGYKKQKTSRASRVIFNQRVVYPTAIVDARNFKQADNYQTRFSFLDNHYCDCEALPVQANLQKHCNVLQYLDLYYSHPLNSIICYKHGCALPLDRWQKHLLNGHSSENSKWRKTKELTAMKEHVSRAFQPASSDSTIVIPDCLQTILPMAELYDGVRPPILKRYPCPVPECHVWRAVSINKTSGNEHDLRKHVEEFHKLSLSDFPQRTKLPEWTQNLKLGGRAYHTFRLPLGWKPPAISDTPRYPLQSSASIELLCQSPPEPNTPVPPQVSWMHDLGWHSYRLSMPWTEQSLMRALEYNSVNTSSSQGLKWLEMGLGMIGAFLPKYLSNANAFLDKLHPSIRKAINSGSKRGAFRPLTEGRYKQYGMVLGQVVSLTLRMLHENVVSFEEAARPCLCCTQKQFKAAVNLYQVIMKGMGAPDKTILLSRLHKFLDSLLRPGELPMTQMAFPTDLLMFALSLRPSNTYSTSSVIASNCAALRYSLLSIYTHVVRCLKEGLEDFTWHEEEISDTSELFDDLDAFTGHEETEEPTNTISDDDNDADEEDIEDVLESYFRDICALQSVSTADDVPLVKDSTSESGFFGDNGSHLKGLCDKLGLESYPHNADELFEDQDANRDLATPQSILGIIQHEIGCVTSHDEVMRSTPFSRIHRVWGSISSTAVNEMGSLHFKSLQNGYIWSFQRYWKEARFIDMRKWAASCKSAMDNFQASLSLLVFQSVDDAMHHIEIKDNKVREAPHRQSANLETTTTAQNRLFSNILVKASTGDNENVERYLRSWLAEEQKALEFLAIILCLACGVSFRGWQLASIYFDCSGHQDRNLWIVNGRVLVSHPKAKQRLYERAPTLLAFPVEISRYLAYYAAVIRPTACLVLRHLEIDDSLHSVKLWCCPAPPESTTKAHPIMPWSGRHISFCLQKFTQSKLGISLTPLLARQISEAVIRDKFPRLFDQPTLTAALADCAHLSSFPQWSDLTPETAIQILMISEIWQAMLNLETTTRHSPWLTLVESSQIFPNDITKNWPIAFRKAVRILDDSCISLITKSNKELIGLPNIIVPVLRHLLFGIEFKSVDTDLPLYGLHCISVARALQIIKTAAMAANLDEKISTSFICAHLDGDSAKTLYESILEEVEQLKQLDMEAWDKLSRDVYSVEYPCYSTMLSGGEGPSTASDIINLITVRAI